MFNRKTTPKVRDGRVQKKNRHTPTRLNSLGVGLLKPGKDLRHVTSRQDVWKFLRLLPDWKRVSTDLDLIYLGRFSNDDYDGWDGWYQSGPVPEIALCAWPDSLRLVVLTDYYQAHREIFRLLGVVCKVTDSGIECQFTEDSARAYQLTHVFLHELGHHYDRISRAHGKDWGSEKFAEDYAILWQRRIWRKYCEQFRFHPQPAPFADEEEASNHSALPKRRRTERA